MQKCSKKIILGSGSPRRRELLAGLDVEFSVDTGNYFEESIPGDARPEDVPLLMSEGKSRGFHRPLETGELLITADTVVVIGGRVLGKPHGREQAAGMLEELSGKTHEVVSAVSFRTTEGMHSITDRTLVHVRSLSEDEISYYIDKFRPFDKAGAYGIQEWFGYAAIDRIDGSYYNVVGFPVHRVWEVLREL